MNVLCFDISSGGLASAVFNEELAPSDIEEILWNIHVQPDGSAVLDPAKLLEALKTRKDFDRVDAISFSGFMHSSLLLDANDRPLTPIFTWMDRRGVEAVDLIRRELGASFHQRTGCRFHPMFPIFKLAWLQMPQARRCVSAKAFAIAALTGKWVEDHGTASASGLYNVREAGWDADLMRRVRIDPDALPPLVERHDIVEHYEGKPVVAGSGDGFLANLGSGCDSPSRMAITLGTSSSARLVLPSAVLDDDAGTFCYRASKSAFLLGCASNNGGNVLDWARSVFGGVPETSTSRSDIPTFIPLLNGERSPEWDPSLTARWVSVTSQHTTEDLARAVLDGVVFNLAHYADILTRASGAKPSEVILSGNGFMNPLAAETLAAVMDTRVLKPRTQGVASLRGAAVCGFQALGVDTSRAMEKLIADSEIIQPRNVPETRQRYKRYRVFRSLPVK